MVDIANEALDLSIKPQDIINKPLSVGKKMLAGLEVVLGATAQTTVSKLITEKAKLNGNLVDAGIAVASMIGAGAVSSADLTNFLSGMAAGSTASLVSKIADYIMKRAGFSNPFTGLTETAKSASTSNLDVFSYTDGYAF